MIFFNPPLAQNLLRRSVYFSCPCPASLGRCKCSKIDEPRWQLRYSNKRTVGIQDDSSSCNSLNPPRLARLPFGQHPHATAFCSWLGRGYATLLQSACFALFAVVCSARTACSRESGVLLIYFRKLYGISYFSKGEIGSSSFGINLDFTSTSTPLSQANLA